jgi:hypothetical protein
MKVILLIKFSIVAFIASFLLICGCTDMNVPSITLRSESLTEKELSILSSKKIFFGHQSVGYNIIDGLKDIMARNPKIILNIQETTDIKNYPKGVFAHFPIGMNTQPKSKIDAFVQAMDNGLGKQVDISFFKFCYIDINQDTDIKDLVHNYVTAINNLKNKYPHVVFCCVTAPITAEGELLSFRDRIKDIIKKLSGKTTNQRRNALCNIKRNEFNKLLRNKCGSENSIDLEQFESTKPDGSRFSSREELPEHFTLIPDYTIDGGHLNKIGRLLVADRLLVRLVEIR